MDAVEDEIVVLVRSQMAAVFGNLAAVFPTVVLLDGVWLLVTGAPWVSSAKAGHLIESLSPFNGTLIFAAFTGVLLWFSSLMAAWAVNSPPLAYCDF